MNSTPPGVTRVMDSAGVAALISSLADGLTRSLGASRDVALIGIYRGGVALARRLAVKLQGAGFTVDVGTADIGLYRDDAHLALPRPNTHPTDILFTLDGRHVVIVDDVFWSGRTARAALDEVLDFGRPKRLWLASLVTRTGRELPISPDVSAVTLEALPTEKIELRLTEDGHAEDALVIVRKGAQ